MDHRFRRAALALVFPIALAAIIGGSGCSSDTVKPASELAPPTAVAAEDGDGFVTISWTASPDQSRSDFTGYNVYRWTSSLADTAAGRLDHYLVGRAQASVSSFSDDFNSSGGQNGVRYYYHVRSNGNGLSIASNEVQGAGRYEGTGAVIEEYRGHLASGFHFATGDSVSLNVSNPDRFTLTDMYLGTTEAQNDIAGDPAVKSPSTLEYANPDWSGIVTSILDLGSQAAWKVQTAAEPSDDSQTVTQNHIYVFKTPSGNYAKIQVISITGDPGARILTFRYAYQPTSGLYLF